MRGSIALAARAAAGLSLFLLMSCPSPLMNDIKAKEAAESGKSFNSFVFKEATNAELYADVIGVIDDKAHTVALTVPKWVPRTGLVATFQFQGAGVSVDGVRQTSGVTPHDFTQPLAYTVTPITGTPVTYTVTATTGTRGLMGGTIQGAPLSLSGKVTTFAGKASPFGNPAGVVYVSPYLYVADSQFSVIWRVDSLGQTTLFAGSLGNPGSFDSPTATSAKFNGPTGLATDNTNLYVADTFNNRVRMIVIATGAVSTLAGSGSFGTGTTNDGIGTAAKMAFPSGLFYDGTTVPAAPVLYVTDKGNLSNQGSVSGAVRSIDLTAGPTYKTVKTLGTYPYAITPALSAPVGVTLYSGNLYVTDSYNHAVYWGSASAAFAPLVYAGTAGTSGFSNLFDAPIGIAASGTHLYVADSLNHAIQEVTTGGSTGTASSFLGVITQPGYVNGSGATSMTFNTPNDICIVGTGNSATFYITESGNLVVREVRFTNVGLPYSSKFAGVPPGSANGTGAAASFSSPRFVTTNGSTMWVSDQTNDVIRSIDLATGTVSIVAGQVGVASEFDGVGTGAEFDSPGGLTTDGKSLYISDSFGQTIRKMNLATNQVTTIASAGFNRPAGLTTDGTNLYVADYQNNEVKVFDLSTNALTMTIGTGVAGSLDGPGASATLNNPIGITTDGTNLYVAENTGFKVRKIAIGTWVVSTLAGPASPTVTAGYVNSPTAPPLFRALTGITTDGTSVYVPDFNQVIRKIDIQSGAVSTLVGAAPPLVAPSETDGVGAAARFNKSHGIVSDGKSIFVVDVGSNVIRRIQ